MKPQATLPAVWGPHLCGWGPWGRRPGGPDFRSPAGPGLQGRFRGMGPHHCLACAQSPGLHPGVSLQAQGPEELRTPGPCWLRLDSPWLQR